MLSFIQRGGEGRLSSSYGHLRGRLVRKGITLEKKTTARVRRKEGSTQISRHGGKKEVYIPGKKGEGLSTEEKDERHVQRQRTEAFSVVVWKKKNRGRAQRKGTPESFDL